LAPHLSAEVAQSKAVSPAPSTTTEPCKRGKVDLQAHIPALLPLATCGRKLLEVKKPCASPKPAKTPNFFGSGRPIPTKMAE
jgi:hypothetical protein